MYVKKPHKNMKPQGCLVIEANVTSWAKERSRDLETKREEGLLQEGRRRCLGNKGCPVMQINFFDKMVSLEIALFLA